MSARIIDFKAWKARVRRKCSAPSCRRVIRPASARTEKPYCSYGCAVRGQQDHVTIGNISGGSVG